MLTFGARYAQGPCVWGCSILPHWIHSEMVPEGGVVGIGLDPQSTESISWCLRDASRDFSTFRLGRRKEFWYRAHQGTNRRGARQGRHPLHIGTCQEEEGKKGILRRALCGSICSWRTIMEEINRLIRGVSGPRELVRPDTRRPW